MNNHPNPQFERDSYISLNGKWKLNGTDIIVPYAPESVASGVGKRIEGPLEYIKKFVGKDFGLKSTLTTCLHFEAVDQVSDIYFNDIHVCHHEGGYLPFSIELPAFDINKESTIRVVVMDALNHKYPYGKQRKDNGGMWYEPVSGIWQEVWLEQYPEQHITSIETKCTLDSITIKIPDVTNATIHIFNTDKRYEYNGGELLINIENPRLWTLDDPYLYNFEVVSDYDYVRSYFALRTITKSVINGYERILLNNKPIFLNGVLDQGYFKDGIMTANGTEDYEQDISRMKELGFNVLRKHIKIEPAIFYYLCDKIGMLVIQDMVNNGDYKFFRDTVLGTINFKINDRVDKYDERQELFINHSQKIIKYLTGHPSVIAYTIFNEGWGQFDSDNVYSLLKSIDGSRLYDSTSGWFAQSNSDFESHHVYFRIKKLKQRKKAMILSECGGYSLLVEKHYFGKKKYGYGACNDLNELTSRIVDMYERMVITAIPNGLSGCIYTQLSDIEDEINGFYTYDRKICKVEKDRIIDINNKVYGAFESAVK